MGKGCGDDNSFVADEIQLLIGSESHAVEMIHERWASEPNFHGSACSRVRSWELPVDGSFMATVKWEAKVRGIVERSPYCLLFIKRESLLMMISKGHRKNHFLWRKAGSSETISERLRGVCSRTTSQDIVLVNDKLISVLIALLKISYIINM